MRNTFFIECILCALLLFSGIILSFRENQTVAEAGTFGGNVISNDTFEDFSKNLFRELTA